MIAAESDSELNCHRFTGYDHFFSTWGSGMQPTLNKRINNIVNWEHRAAEARSVAESLFDAHAKEVLLKIAKEYDGLAMRSAERELSEPR